MSLLYNGSRYGGARGDPRVCSCAISTSDCDSPARLKFRAVDLRLHSYNDITSCKTHSRVSLQDTVTSQSLRCQRDYFQKGFRDLFYSSSPYARMSLYNQPGVYPTQVWLEVTGKGTYHTPISWGKIIPVSVSDPNEIDFNRIVYLCTKLKTWLAIYSFFENHFIYHYSHCA